jgi:hypothetical protein
MGIKKGLSSVYRKFREVYRKYGNFPLNYILMNRLAIVN